MLSNNSKGATFVGIWHGIGEAKGNTLKVKNLQPITWVLTRDVTTNNDECKQRFDDQKKWQKFAKFRPNQSKPWLKMQNTLPVNNFESIGISFLLVSHKCGNILHDVASKTPHFCAKNQKEWRFLFIKIVWKSHFWGKFSIFGVTVNM